MTTETGRIEAFSDGIFSIAATLLVLDLKPPTAGLPFWQGIVVQLSNYELRTANCELRTANYELRTMNYEL